ncbi:MAG: hypothetical protein NW220_15970 [Leptolyngbyaceae cyanobacterium bins.349]|nr:hypothetical protein [Leptolyngbyaceae cyanobacterium bins.349]
MNLPVVLDIAIGLVFIYLIASLLASEIQELVSTILQWRAKHLRESIQNLLAGGQGTARDEQLGGFLEAIYNDPLIKNMNQSSRGMIGSFGQWLYRCVFYRGRSVFGRQTTAPSYISSETFATALLERIGMATLVTKLTEVRLEKFVGRIVGQYDVQELSTGLTITIPTDEFFQDKDYREKGAIRVLAEKAKTVSSTGILGIQSHTILSLHSHPDFIALVEEYDDLLRDFKAGEADLETCIERMKEGLDVYISQISMQSSGSLDGAPPGSTDPIAIAAPALLDAEVMELEPPNSAQADVERQQLMYFKKRLSAFKNATFGEKTERAIAAGRLKPSLLEIAEVFDRASLTYQEIEGAYQDIAAAYGTGLISQKIRQFLDTVNHEQAHRTPVVQKRTPPELTPLPNRPLTLADLAEPAYQPALAAIAQQLRPEDRQIYKDWQRYQTSFAKIITAIATCLQSQGRLLNQGIELTQPVADLDLNTLHLSVVESLKAVEPRESANLDQMVIAQLERADQLIYKGWRIYQQIVLTVVRDLAYSLQEEERFFDYRTRTEFNQLPTVLDDADLYQSVKYSLHLMSNEERQLRINGAARKLATDQRKLYNNYQTYEQIQDLLGGVPASVKQSLAILARRAQTKIDRTQDQLDQFNFEVSRWFDRSMSRASGVYKRNAKGVALMIGFLIAILANADTFHVVARLSGDDDLRQIITTRASSITQNADSQELYSRDQLRRLKQDTDAVLQEISLPLRWTPENLSQQFNCPTSTPAPEATAALTPWKSFYQTCLNEANAPEQFDLLRVGRIALRPQNLVDSGRMLIGWIVSGIAIAMGAPFWFDILSKIMNVRNTGAKPATAEKESPKP